MKKGTEKNTGEKKIQGGIVLGKKNIGDIEFLNGLNELDGYLKDLDPNLMTNKKTCADCGEVAGIKVAEPDKIK